MGYPVRVSREFRYQGEVFLPGDIFDCPTEHMRDFMCANNGAESVTSRGKTRKEGSHKLVGNRKGKYATRQMKAGGPDPELDSREMTADESDQDS